MEKHIKEILEDIYMVDESLRKHDKELTELAKKLFESRPDTQYSQEFAEQLRVELLKKVDEIKEVKTPTFFPSFNFSSKITYALGGAVLATILIIPIFSSLNNINTKESSDKLSMNIGVRQLEPKAFGALLDSNLSNAREEAAPVVTGKGGGGGVVRDQSGGGYAASTESVSGKMIIPEVIEYKIVYEGDEFELEGETRTVYKRVKDDKGGRSLANYVTKLNVDIIDLSNFKNSTMANLSLNEDREFGYSLHFNFLDNSISVSQNWKRWPHPSQKCAEQSCYERYRLKINDVPTDDRVIKIAKEFAEAYNIDLTNYGEPIINDRWRDYYDSNEDREMAYIPEQLNVVFPLVIDGQMIYDQSGGQSGINISVDIRNMKGAGAHMIHPYNFESSEYSVINDKNKVLEMAEQGGMNRHFVMEEVNKRKVKVSLGTPYLGLMKYLKYQEDKGTADELYIPAMIFPVNEVANNEVFYQENIVVPLVEYFINEMQSPDDGIRPMPLLREPAIMEVEVEVGEDIDNDNENTVFPEINIAPDTIKIEEEVKGVEEIVTPDKPKSLKTQIRFSE